MIYVLVLFNYINEIETCVVISASLSREKLTKEVLEPFPLTLRERHACQKNMKRHFFIMEMSAL